MIGVPIMLNDYIYLKVILCYLLEIHVFFELLIKNSKYLKRKRQIKNHLHFKIKTTILF